MKRIRMLKAWGRRQKGAELEVWEPGDTFRPGMVDPTRAAELLRGRFAEAIPEPKGKATESPQTAARAVDDGSGIAPAGQAPPKAQKAKG